MFIICCSRNSANDIGVFAGYALWARQTQFYSSLSIGELSRLRTSLLNFFRESNFPVGALIADGYQADSGQLMVSTHGPNACNLGAATVYNEDGDVMDEYVLPIAGKNVADLSSYFGENLFCQKRVQERLARLYDADYYRNAELDNAIGEEDMSDSHGAFVRFGASESDRETSPSSERFGVRGSQSASNVPSDDDSASSSSASYAARLEAIKYSIPSPTLRGASLGRGVRDAS